MSMYDLTGIDPDFLRTDVRFKVFTAGQPMSFKEAAFASSVVVYWLENDITPHLLTEGVHYEHTLADRAYDAMSEAKLIDNTFIETLINGIHNLDAFTGDRTYVVEYQAFYQQPALMDFGDNGPAPTPGIMNYLIENVNYLKEVKDPLGGITSTTLDSIRVLEEDLTGVNDDNLIEDELHTVNVPAGQQIIRPGSGAFYSHDVVLKNASNDVLLVEGTDYNIIGLNRPKTAVAEHTSAVYDYIFLLTPFVGQLKVTYRAFGGDVTVADINAVKDVLADIVYMVTNGEYLTLETLAVTSVITSIAARIAELEDDVYHYVTGTHQYEATSDGKHWFSIATLYRDNWNVDTLRTANVHLAIQSHTQHWAYEAMLAINLDHPTDKLQLKVLSSSDRYNQFALSIYDTVDQRNIPSLRIVWKDNGTDLTGAVIQVGLDMVAGVEEITSVTDKSGNSSDINIRDNIIGVDVVADDNIELPDGDTWVEADPDNFSAEYVLCPDDGYLAWGGAIPMTEILDTWHDIEHSIDYGDFDITDIKKTLFYVYDRIDDRMLVVVVDRINDGNEIITGGAIFYPHDLCSIGYTLSVSAPDVTLQLRASLGTHSINNERFDLRQIVFQF